MRPLALIAAAAIVMDPGVGHAGATPSFLVPPVDAPIERGFEPPSTAFGPGHRGVDFPVPAGTTVVAAGTGTVSFAGPVAGNDAVTIDHGSGLVTTYSVLSSISVSVGERVTAGIPIGTAGVTHPSGPEGVHFGMKLDGAYVDPRERLLSQDVSAAIRLVDVPVGDAEKVWDVFGVALPRSRFAAAPACVDRRDLEEAVVPPNDNIAVAVAGIGSSSESADIFEHPPQLLGYPSERVYRFSYSGTDAAGLHRAYEPRDTFDDIRRSAAELAEMLRRIKKLHPGRGVDLIAHSQGGIVSRTFLELMERYNDDSLPVIEHLVTFSSPHEGAPIAGEMKEILDDGSLGALALELVGGAARRGMVALPDPTSDAVGQLAPGSELMEALAAGTTPFGTRYLSLSIPEDIVVPATVTQMPNGVSRTVRSEWSLSGHSAITASHQARAMAYDFLRDAGVVCTSGSDLWGRWIGGLISASESLFAESIGLIGP
jgi:hypothetical protein